MGRQNRLELGIAVRARAIREQIEAKKNSHHEAGFPEVPFALGYLDNRSRLTDALNLLDAVLKGQPFRIILAADGVGPERIVEFRSDRTTDEPILYRSTQVVERPDHTIVHTTRQGEEDIHHGNSQ